ncbi:MAG: ATP-binding protein [Muribaculaceae bacterium]|nr:ATP-binding protein [Muribaculaceae bacterium]
MEQPKFWLQVRSEYIFENFDALTSYLRSYQYMDSEDDNFEYNSTLECMRTMSEEYAKRSFATPFFKSAEFDHPLPEIVRVMCATILAAHKAGQTLHTVIAGLIDIILKAEAGCPSNVATGLVNVVLNCIKCRNLLSPGFSWKEVDNQANNYDLLATRLSQITFKTDTSNGPNDWFCFENKGMILLSPEGRLSIAAMNNKQYTEALQHSNLTDCFSLPEIFTVQVPKDEYKRYSDFDRLFIATDKLMRSMELVKPATIAKKGVYGPEDEFVVKVLRKQGYKIEAETVDPAFETIHGNVLLDITDNRPAWSTVVNTIEPGKYLLVKRLYNNSCAFTIKTSLEMDYRYYAAGFADQYAEGVFLRNYSSGMEFVTRDGIHVGLAAEKIDELSDDERADLEFCCHEGLPVPLRMYREPPKLDGSHFNMYAEIDRESLAAAADIHKHIDRFTVDEAERALLTDLMRHWEEDAINIIRVVANFVSTEADKFIPILTALHRISERGLPSCRLRLEFLTAMAMMCRIMGRTSELSYIKYQREFLRQEVNFAHGETISKLPEVTGENMPIELTNCHRIINILSEYQKSKPVKHDTAPKPRVVSIADEPVDIEKTKALVDASNSLLNLLDNAQMDGIKQFICRSLDIEDEYVSILDNRTFYGVESISLEFKSSVVYPPSNRRRYTSAVADPELQKWAILKAVCGFLNSRSGGELLIGVKDTGYACGIADDVRELSRLGKIAAPSSDFYRTYIQNLIDYSFTVQGKDVSPRDVTRFYVDSELEDNDEGVTILRVRVKSYPGGLVKFIASDSERPEGVETSYIRQSGRTIPVTPEGANAILNYKKPRK